MRADAGARDDPGGRRLVTCVDMVEHDGIGSAVALGEGTAGQRPQLVAGEPGLLGLLGHLSVDESPRPGTGRAPAMWVPRLNK